MKILSFSIFLGDFFPSWIRIPIRNLYADPDPDPTAQINADPCGSGSGYGSETLPFCDLKLWRACQTCATMQKNVSQLLQATPWILPNDVLKKITPFWIFSTHSQPVFWVQITWIRIRTPLLLNLDQDQGLLWHKIKKLRCKEKFDSDNANYFVLNLFNKTLRLPEGGSSYSKSSTNVFFCIFLIFGGPFPPV